MLPKKRKFTAADYDSFVVRSPSNAGNEDNNAEEPMTLVLASNTDGILMQEQDDSKVFEERASNNCEIEAVKRIVYPLGNNEQQNEERKKVDDKIATAVNDPETVGIDLSRRRHHVSASSIPSPILSPLPPHYIASNTIPSPSWDRTPSCLSENYTEELDNRVSDRQQSLLLQQEGHRHISSPGSGVQCLTRNTTGFSTPIPPGHHNSTRPLSAASDAAQGVSYCRSGRLKEGDYFSEGGNQYFPSQSSAGSNLHSSHPSNVPSSALRVRSDVLPDIDLSDWIGHRILARRLSRDGNCHYYWPGVIQCTFEGNRVSVSLDGEENPLVYDNVLSMSRCAIVSDVVPSTSQVSYLDTSVRNSKFNKRYVRIIILRYW